jgi:hypothetical protein
MSFLSIVVFDSNRCIAQDTSKQSDVMSIADPMHLSINGLTVYASQAVKWEKDVTKLASKNVSESRDDAILFLGSSSIRLWESINADIAPYHPIRRGYGGAKYCDLAIYTPNLIEGLKFRAAVIFVANDVSGKLDDKEPVEVARLSQIVIDAIHKNQPTVPVLLVSVTATPARFAHWNRIESINDALKSVANKQTNVHFLDTKNSYLTKEKSPKPERFTKDNLHQNAEGYKHWGTLIREELAKMLEPR